MQLEGDRNQKVIVSLALVVLTYLSAGVGAIASVSAPEFYVSLSKPDWAPPGWLFGPVWSTLYTLMAISAVMLVWTAMGKQPSKVRGAVGLFGLQLLVNALWSWLFFEWRLGALAFAEVLVLFVLIALTIRSFWFLNKLSACLLLPYLAWVGFACALTWAVWQGNPNLL